MSTRKEEKRKGTKKVGKIIVFLSILILSSGAFFFTPQDWHWMAQSGIFLLLIGITAKFTVLYTPEVTGILTQDVFTGTLYSYSPGVSVRFFWEKITNSFSLKIVTKEFKQTYNASDGPEMEFSATYAYRADGKKLDKYVQVNNATIERTIENGLSTIASSFIAKKNAEAARGAVGEAGKEILSRFEQETKVQENGQYIIIEDAFGTDVVLTRVDDIDYSEEFRKAKAASAQMGQVKEAADKILNGDMTMKDAVNTVLTQEGKADKQIYDFEGVDVNSIIKAISDMVKKRRGGE